LAGTTALNCVEESNVTGFAAVDPNLTVEVELKLAPLIVTVLPPVVEPAFGDTPVIDGGATTVEVMLEPQPLFDAPLLVSPP
jgi:hypothetical protein